MSENYFKEKKRNYGKPKPEKVQDEIPEGQIRMDEVFSKIPEISKGTYNVTRFNSPKGF